MITCFDIFHDGLGRPATCLVKSALRRRLCEGQARHFMSISKGQGVKSETEAYNHDADLLCSVSSIDLRYCDAARKWRHLTSMCTDHSLEMLSEIGRGT